MKGKTNWPGVEASESGRMGLSGVHPTGVVMNESTDILTGPRHGSSISKLVKAFAGATEVAVRTPARPMVIPAANRLKKLETNMMN